MIQYPWTRKRAPKAWQKVRFIQKLGYHFGTHHGYGGCWFIVRE